MHGPVRERIVDILLRFPNGITKAALMHEVYWNARGAGPNSRQAMHVNIHNANVELSTIGYRIIADRGGPGSLYKLVKLDADTKRQPARNHHARTMERPQPASHARND